MSIPVLFKQHFQIAYVVRNLAAARARLAREFGVAEWDVMDMAALMGPGHGTRYIGNSFAGDTMIELIEPDPAGDSIYRDWIPPEEDGVRLHHLGFLVRSDEDFKAAIAQLGAAGYPTAVSGSFGDALDYHYADTTALLGHYYELINLKPAGEQFFARIPRN
ncbi:MAG: VOC family protein [Sphingopyxis sp.]